MSMPRRSDLDRLAQIRRLGRGPAADVTDELRILGKLAHLAHLALSDQLAHMLTVPGVLVGQRPVGSGLFGVIVL